MKTIRYRLWCWWNGYCHKHFVLKQMHIGRIDYYLCCPECDREHGA